MIEQEGSVREEDVSVRLSTDPQQDDDGSQQPERPRRKSNKVRDKINEDILDLDQREIELIYKSQQFTQGSICVQFLLITCFFLYQIQESFHFLDVIGMIENVSKPINYGGIISKDEIIVVQNISQWIDGLLPDLYTDQTFDLKMKIPADLQLNGTDTSFLNLTLPDFANYAVFFKNNYFTGMRISTVYTDLTSTQKTIFEEVIPEKRTRKYTDPGEPQPSLSEPPVGEFVYRTKASIAADPSERGGSVYGLGYVNFFPANQSLKSAKASLKHMGDVGWWNDRKHLSTTVEMMFYNEMIHIGLIKTYRFFTNNQGFIELQERATMFLPQNYFFKSDSKVLSIYKTILVAVLVILVTFEAVTHVFLLVKKTRSLFKHRVNEFQLRDFTSLLQTAFFITLFIYGGILFVDQVMERRMFSLPIRAERDFQYWVDWGETFIRFRMMMGIIAILQCLNFLLVASNYVPSLGILFETLSRAKRDILTFTMIVILVFVVSSVACTLLYGDRMEVFKTLSSSLITNFQMFFGEIPYEQMYETNPIASAVHFVSFVFVFFFFVMNIYTAIIVQTYQKLRRKKFLLSAALWRIIQDEMKTKITNWVNLLILRPSRSADSDFAHDPEHLARQSRMQILRNNWAIINRKNITTKEQFVDRLAKTANEMRVEQIKAIQQQQERLQGLRKDSQHAESSAKILKRNLVFIFYLAVSWPFFTVSTNNMQKQAVIKPIQDYLAKPVLISVDKSQRFKTLESVEDYGDITNYMDKLSENFFLQRGFGFSRPAGDTFCRLTYSFYSNLVNSNLHTASIFPIITPFANKESAVEQRTYDERLNKQLQSMLILANESALVNRLVPQRITYKGTELQPQKEKDYRASCMGNGGYVFEFGQDRLEKTYKQSINTIMKDFIAQNDFHKLDTLDVELFVYSPVYNLFSYIVIEFKFKPSGQMIPQIFNYTDNPNMRLRWLQLLLFILFGLFTTYFVVNLFFKIKKQWGQITKAEMEARERAHPGCFAVQRSKWSVCLLWIGIDSEELKGFNVVQIAAVSIFLVIKHFFKTLIKLVKSLLKECGTNIFNYVEIIILILNLQIISSHAQLIAVARHQHDPKQLQSASEMAQAYTNYSYYTGISILMMFFKSLEIFQFSMVANLTISTITTGFIAIVNYIMIFIVLLFGEATAAYIVFGSEVRELSSVQASLFNLLKMLNGAFLYQKMNAVNPLFATPFFVYVLTLHWLLLLNILIGLIKGQFFEQYENLLTGERQKTLKENWTDGFYLTVWRILSEEWIQAYHQKAHERRKRRRSIKSPADTGRSTIRETTGNVKETGENSLFEADFEPQFTWGHNWPVPSWVVTILNWWLDPYEKRLQTESKKVIEAADDEKLDSSFEVSEHQEFKTEQDLGGDEAAEELLTPFKLDQDYKVDKGINPYLRNFDEVFQVATQIEQLSQKKDLLSKIEQAKKERELKRLTQTSSVMKLRDQWYVNGQQNRSNADSNFWLFHLDENLMNLTKRQTCSLHEMRCLDTFFSSQLINRFTPFTGFQQYVQTIVEDRRNPSAYQTLLQKLGQPPDKVLLADFQNRFEGNHRNAQVLDSRVNTEERVFRVAMNYKYAAWQTIDRLKRRDVCQSLLQRKSAKESESTHGTLALKIISTLEHLNSSQANELDKAATNKLIAQELTFDALCGSAWRNRHLNMVCEDLRKVWRNLSLPEKFELWYNRFDVRERVRLWNALVFSIEWFNHVVTNSENKGKKLGPHRKDVQSVVKSIRKKQDSCAEDHAKRMGLHSLSAKEKEELMYLAYGPTQLQKLWETLTKEFKKTRASSYRPKEDSQLPTDPRRQMFEGGSSDREETQNDDANGEEHSKQGSSTGVGSGRNADNDLSEEVADEGVKSGDAKVDQSSQYYAQIQFFFRNMVNRLNGALKETRSEQDKAPKDDEQNNGQARPKVIRTAAQFESIIERLQDQGEEVKSLLTNSSKPFEEERLQLWAMLTKHEKFDMLFHQVVLHEAQMMSFLLEAEHGELGTDTSIVQIHEYDNDMETALNQQIYRKYIAYTRLQAIRKSKTYFENRQKAAHEHDQKIIRYASFLKERFAKNEQEISQEQAKYEEKLDERKKLKIRIQKIATNQLEADPQMRENAVMFYNLWKNSSRK